MTGLQSIAERATLFIVFLKNRIEGYTKKNEFATGTSKFYETAYIDTRQGPTGQQGEFSVQGRLK